MAHSRKYIVAKTSVGVIGVTFDWRSASLRAVADLASAAEQEGYEFFWVPEAWGLEAFSTISHVLTKTTKISVGSGIINVYSRSAALIGMGCATLSQLAPGRFLLGLGVSGKGLIEGWHGARFEDPFTRLQEYVEVIRKVLAGGPVEHSGKHLKLSGFRLYTQPPQRPPKMLLAALGQKSLRLAAKLFDGAIVTMYPSSKLADAARTVGSEDPNKTVHYFQPAAVVLGDQTLGDTAYIAKTIAFYVASMGDYYYRALVSLGFEKEAETIRSRYRGGDREGAAAAAQALLDELALVGTPDQIAQKLSSYPANVVPVLSFRATGEEDVALSRKAMAAVKRALHTSA